MYSRFDFLHFYYQGVGKMRFDFKSGKMASADILYARGAVLQDAFILKKRDYKRPEQYMHSPEFINNLHPFGTTV